MKQIIKDNWDEFLHAYYLQECKGCPDGHSSFWRTIITSKEWEALKKYNGKKMNWDFPENEELGILSPLHWKAFISFIKK